MSHDLLDKVLEIPIEIVAVNVCIRNHVGQSGLAALTRSDNKGHGLFSGKLLPDFHVQETQFHAGSFSCH